MTRAIQVTSVARRLVVEADNPMMLVDLPPDPWFVRGPRGGVYLATGERERLITEMGDDWMRGTVSIVDRSEGLKYVRPRSRLYREASA